MSASTEGMAKPIPLDSPICDAIHDLRRLGYTFDQILEETGCQFDFLKTIYLGLNINYQDKKKPQGVQPLQEQATLITPTPTPTLTPAFTPPQRAANNHHTNNPLPLPFASNKWLSRLVIELSDDEDDDEEGTHVVANNSEEGPSDYLTSQMKHLKEQLAILERAKLNKAKKEQSGSSNNSSESPVQRSPSPMDGIETSNSKTDSTSDKNVSPLMHFEPCRSDIDELKRLNSLLESIQITLLTRPVPNTGDSTVPEPMERKKQEEYSLSLKLSELYQQQIRLIKVKILKERHNHCDKRLLQEVVYSRSEEDYLNHNEIIYPPSKDIDGTSSDELIQLEQSDEEDDEILTTTTNEPSETLTNKAYVDNIESLELKNASIVSEILKARPTTERFIPYESTIKQFRFSRINPHFPIQLLKSSTYSNKIDSDSPFCLNEINGCNKETNPSCEYQHFTVDESYMNETEIIMDLIKNLPLYLSIDIPKSVYSDTKTRKSMVTEIKQKILGNPNLNFQQIYHLILDYRLEVIQRYHSL